MSICSEGAALIENDGLTETLERVTRELRAIVGNIEDLERALGEAYHARDTPIREIQDLDAIRQRVGGVANFLDALNEALPAAGSVNANAAARVVTLADMAARLGGVDPSREQANFAPPELYELF
jgi:hypothetical protein